MAHDDQVKLLAQAMGVSVKELTSALAGLSPPEVVTGTFTYSSSIDASVTGLYAKYAFMRGEKRPLLTQQHGINIGVEDIPDSLMLRLARAGFFVVAFGLRGENGAGGADDRAGREVQDLFDGLEWVRGLFWANIDDSRIGVMGYSGGGSVALSFATKFPDYANIIVSHFGVSDFGVSQTTGHGYQLTSKQAGIVEAVGSRPRSDWSGTAAINLDPYSARNVRANLGLNYKSGKLYLRHDQLDGSVKVEQTTELNTALAATPTSQPQRDVDISVSGETDRYYHGPPQGDNPNVARSMKAWGPDLIENRYPQWTFPAANTGRVMGWLVTKRFSIWLGTGTDEVAALTYDTVAGTFTLTPETGSMSVTIRMDGKVLTQTISAATTLTMPSALTTTAKWEADAGVTATSGAVTAWNDVDHSFSASKAGGTLTLVTNVFGTLPGLLFDGGYLNYSLASIIPQPFAFLAVVRLLSLDNQNPIYSWSTSLSGARSYFSTDPYRNWRWQANAFGAALYTPEPPEIGKTYVVSALFNGANSLVRVNRKTVAAGTLGGEGYRHIRIGARSTGGDPLRGYLGAIVFAPPEQLRSLETYLTKKYLGALG